MRSLSCVLLYCGSALVVSGQMVVPGGTELRIAEGTRLLIDAPIDMAVEIGASVVNDGTIILHEEARIIESDGSPITGVGTERITQEHAAPLVGLSPGGLGLQVTTILAPGTLVVERGHMPLEAAGGASSIARWFEVGSTTTTGAHVALSYDATELNGLDPSALMLFRRSNAAAPWAGHATMISGMHTLEADLDSLGTITAFDSSVNHTGLPLMDAIASEGFLLYPNPATGPVTITSTGNGYVERLELFTTDGRLVAVKRVGAFRSGPLPIALHGLARGRYVLRINGTHRLPLLIP